MQPAGIHGRLPRLGEGLPLADANQRQQLTVEERHGAGVPLGVLLCGDHRA